MHAALFILSVYAGCWLLGYHLAHRNCKGRPVVRKQVCGVKASTSVLVPMLLLALLLIAAMFEAHPEQAYAEAGTRAYLAEGLYGSVFFAVIFGASTLYAFTRGHPLGEGSWTPECR